MLNSFLLNIFLALVWTFLQGELQARNFAIGMIVGYLIIAVSQRVLGNSAYAQKAPQVVSFLLYVLWDIFTASLSLAWIIVHPRLQIRPGVVAIPLDAETDMEIVTMANWITLSPGSVSLDVSTDRRTLYVHAMVLEDADEFRRTVKEEVERRVLEVTR